VDQYVLGGELDREPGRVRLVVGRWGGSIGVGRGARSRAVSGLAIANRSFTWWRGLLNTTITEHKVSDLESMYVVSELHAKIRGRHLSTLNGFGIKSYILVSVSSVYVLIWGIFLRYISGQRPDIGTSIIWITTLLLNESGCELVAEWSIILECNFNMTEWSNGISVWSDVVTCWQGYYPFSFKCTCTKNTDSKRRVHKRQIYRG
jgi:hypothetical protein